jgi:hypothetical protein
VAEIVPAASGEIVLVVDPSAGIEWDYDDDAGRFPFDHDNDASTRLFPSTETGCATTPEGLSDPAGFPVALTGGGWPPVQSAVACTVPLRPIWSGQVRVFDAKS